MLKTVRNAFKVEDIRKRLLYTLLMLVVVRFGSQLPTPGVDPTFIQNFFAQQTGDAFNFFEAFTGGSFTRMSVFALSITPYITSSIIMQLLTIAIPKLEEMQKDGEDGRKKIAFLMWIGERITEKGVGNGISIVLLINIISRVPDDLVTLYTQFMSGKKLAKAGLAGIIILAILLVVIVFVIILQDGERRIAVQYSKKVQGRKTYGGQSSHIPLKVNTAGVIPVIFSSSLMQTPIVIAQFLGKGNGTGIGSKILAGLNSNNWCDPENPIYSIGLVVYILLTIFFAYFYTSITFNPMEIANNMKKSGGFIPGIRPGKPTVDYLTKILNYIIFIGACGLIIVQVIPYFFNGVFGANVSFGGTSLIIIVGVVLETIKKIESQMLVRNYTGFLNNKGSNMKNSYLGY